MIQEVQKLACQPAKLRQFAAAWLIFLLAFGLHQWLARGREALGMAMAALAISVGVLGLIKPASIRWLFVSAMTLAFPIGWLVSHAVLALMFYCVLTPVAIFFRLCRRDLLWRKPASNRPSLWMPKSTPQDVRSYFRQY